MRSSAFLKQLTLSALAWFALWGGVSFARLGEDRGVTISAPIAATTPTPPPATSTPSPPQSEPSNVANARQWVIAPAWQGYFDALRDARNQEEAQRIEANIARMLARTGSSTVDFLLERADGLKKAGKLEAARALLDQSVGLAPEAAEPWRRRGEVAALQHDYALAIDDLTRAVEIEPAHFLALQSLGQLYEDSHDAASALATYQAAFALDPWLLDVRAGLARLGADVPH